MIPRLRERATGYQIDFHDEEGEPYVVRFDFDKVEDTAWGVKSNITVKTNIKTRQRLPGNIVLQNRINILDNGSTREMARRIGSLIPSPPSGASIEWQRLLEHATILIQNERNQSVPIINLADGDVPLAQKFDIEGLLAQNKTNIIYGAGGTGKSVLGGRIAASLITGRSLFGLDVMSRGRTLYLDWEDDADTMIDRTERISQGMGIERFDMAYMPLAGQGPYEKHHADVRNRLNDDPNIRLVIFDSTAMAMHGSSAGEGADGAIRFFTLLAQLPVTRLLIDHLASDDVKAGDGAKKPYGSVFKVNAARNMWEAVPWDPAIRGGQGITLEHRKTNVGPRCPNIDVQIGWQNGSVSFTKE